MTLKEALEQLTSDRDTVEEQLRLAKARADYKSVSKLQTLLDRVEEEIEHVEELLADAD